MRLASLRDIYQRSGPFATVYLDTSANGSEDVRARWDAVRQRLAAQGADANMLATLAEQIGTQSSGGQVLVADKEKVLIDDELPAPPPDMTDDVYFGPLPQLMPYLRLRGPHIPHVLAVVDDTGADVTVVPPTRRSETTRMSDEQAVAEEISKRAEDIHARAIVLAGAEERRKLVHERLDDKVRDQVVETGAPSLDRAVSGEALRAEVGKTVDAAVQAKIAEAVREFEQERGRSDRAVEGWVSTLDALRGEQVRALLWDPERTRSDILYIGPKGSEIATDEQALREHEVESISSVPADAAIVRALAETEGEFFPVDQRRLDLIDGVGALLR